MANDEDLFCQLSVAPPSIGGASLSKNEMGSFVGDRLRVDFNREIAADGEKSRPP